MPTALQRTVGRYRLDSLIGKGGMAEVYRATDTRLDRTVAVKMILPNLVSQPALLARFLREARLVAGLEHPNILPIYDFGEQDGAPYLVTPMMSGGTLADRIGESGLPPEQVVDLVTQLAAALDTAHAAGILHRDVKPTNVLMDRIHRPVLADFGLARVADVASDLTATGIMVGTPLYMAPELAQGAEASRSSDLYALGVLTYQMLCGRLPFSAETPVAVLHQHVAQEAPRLSESGAGLPAAVDDTLARALAKLPEERFSSGADLAQALGAALGCILPAVTPPATAVDGPGPVSPATAQPPADALIDGSLTITPVPAEPAVSAPVAPAPPRTGTRWSIVLIVLFAVLGIMLGARSLLGRTERSKRQRHVPAVASTQSSPDDLQAHSGTSESPRARPFRLAPALDADAFEAMAERAATGLRFRPDEPSLRGLAAYADGGLAYAKGDDRQARDAIDRVREALGERVAVKGVPSWIADGKSAEALTDWELAAIYGDARGTGLPAVEARLAEAPGDIRARIGHAQLLHLDGRHEDAIEQARALYADTARGDARIAGQLMRFVADEYSELGRWDDAVRAYRQAVEAGGPVVAQAGMDGGRIARDRLDDPVTAQDLFRAACVAGNDVACREVSRTRMRRLRRASR